MNRKTFQINGKSAVFFVSAAGVAAIILLACIAPWVTPCDPLATDYINTLCPPMPGHWLGCDVMGRDLLSRIIAGARISVLMGLAAVALPAIVGIGVGFIAAYIGGWADTLLMRVADLFQSFPEFILGVAIVGVLGPSMLNAFIAIIAVTWIRYARQTRSLVIGIVHAPFIETARLNGCNAWQIAVRHILPAMLPQTIAMAVLDIGPVMLLLAAFSFLGLGVQPPTPEWGALLNDGRFYFSSAPYLMLFPGVAIFVTVLAFNVLGTSFSRIINNKENRL